MSWANVNAGSNNIHEDMPPLMSDGRNFSSWLPEEVINEKIKKDMGIQSNWEYRKYLQQNATNIMSYNSMKAIEGTGYVPSANNTKTDNVPFMFNSTFDNNTPNGYSSSDLKSQYLSSSQLNARMMAPTIQLNH